MTLEPSRQLTVLPMSPALELELQSSSLPAFSMASVHSVPGVDACDELPKDQQIAELPLSRGVPCACVCVCS